MKGRNFKGKSKLKERYLKEIMLRRKRKSKGRNIERQLKKEIEGKLKEK